MLSDARQPPIDVRFWGNHRHHNSTASGPFVTRLGHQEPTFAVMHARRAPMATSWSSRAKPDKRISTRGCCCDIMQDDTRPDSIENEADITSIVCRVCVLWTARSCLGSHERQQFPRAHTLRPIRSMEPQQHRSPPRRHHRAVSGGRHVRDVQACPAQPQALQSGGREYL